MAPHPEPYLESEQGDGMRDDASGRLRAAALAVTVGLLAAVAVLTALFGGVVDAGATSAADEQRAERVASRTQYVDLSGGDALTLARERFPGLLRGPLLRGAEPRPGLRIVERRGRHSAVVRDERSGERLVLDSSHPLVADAGNERTEPVDFSLRPGTTGFTPARPLTPTWIANGPKARIAVGRSGVGVTLRSDAPVQGVAADDRVFYPEVAADADAVVVPRPLGVQLGIQLRSPRAPGSQKPDELVRPRGKPIGTPGTSPGIRRVSSQKELDELFEQLRAHGTPTSRNYPGTGYDLPGGGFVGRRQSHRFGPTLDVDVPGVHDVRKVHVGGV